MLGANAQAAGPSVYNYRATLVTGEGAHRQVGAAAHLPGGWTLYGSYAYGWGNICKAYALGNDLGGMAHNPHTVTQFVQGSYYSNTTATC